MSGKTTADQPPTEILKALSDPVRWTIIAHAAQVDELAAITLESTLPVAKPTISYHIKILQNAGLISTRKAGRNYYYTLRRDVIEGLADDLWELAPTPRPVIGSQKGRASRRRSARPDQAERPAVSRQRAVNDDVEEAVVLTW
jgi:DNA-binding transcriptional ArsR family regulator